ncbi:MAG: hypothetical protein IT317_24810 [Anaerolineales bacterium]|nr:hypothetical protein [Anaerolineales bacterium]
MAARLAANPRLRERTAALLAADPTAEELADLAAQLEPLPPLEPLTVDLPPLLSAGGADAPEDPMPNPPLNLRVPADLLRRADALVADAGRLPELAAVTTVTRADVLRVALVRGLASVEKSLAARREE